VNIQTSIRVFVFFLTVEGVRVAARSSGEDVNVVVDMTEAGRKFAAPSPAHPVFYLPIVIGYREEGQSIAGEKPPPPAGEILPCFEAALARQGYRMVESTREKPALVVVFAWGSWNPVMVDLPPAPASSDGTSPYGELQNPAVPLNSGDMLGLVAGNTVHNLPWVPDFMTDLDRDAIRSDVKEPHYFALVAAFEWTNVRPHKRVLLWTAKMSIRSTGMWLAEILPAMIEGGGPFFGRETTRRQTVTVPLGPEGRVKLGELHIEAVGEDKLSEQKSPTGKKP
jgi:hypothetical protein